MKEVRKHAVWQILNWRTIIMAQLTPIKLSLNNYIAGSGKSTIASYLVEKHGFVVYNFADKIYELAEELLE